MDVQLWSCNTQGMTSVPHVFIDRYMCDAHGEYVKIYLYLLRHQQQGGTSFSLSKMADALEHTMRDVKRALFYWEKQGLLKLSFDEEHELCGIRINDIPPAKDDSDLSTPRVATSMASDTFVQIPQAPIQEESGEFFADTEDSATPFDAASVTPKHTITSYDASPARLAELKDNEQFKELFYLAERLMGHSLNESTINTILYWYDELSLPADLIEYLIEYCAEKQHTNIRYMNQIALNWTSEGIHSVDEAKASTMRHSDSTYAVTKAFGIHNRTLTKPELAFIERWIHTYGFSIELIEEACHRTILKTQKASFDYAESILRNWYESNVNSLQDIEALDKRHTDQKVKQKTKKLPAETRFQNFPERIYRNLDDIQKKLSGS